MLSLSMLHVKPLFRTLIAVVLGIGLSFLLALMPLLPSPAVPIFSVPNPQAVNGSWVSDTADMLSAESEAQLNQMIAALEAKNGIEIAVVTVPDTQPSSSPKAFATELFNTWKIGKEGADNGVLFLVSKGDRRNEIETGYGIEGVLSDAQIGAILRHQVTPQFKAGQFDEGVLAGTEAMVTILSGETPVTGLVRPVPGLGLGWLFNGLWVAVGTISVAVMTVMKRLATGHVEPIRIGPTGRSCLSASDVFLGPVLIGALRSLIGKEMAHAKGLDLTKGLAQGSSGRSNGGLVGNAIALFAHLPTQKSAVSDRAQAMQGSRLIALRWSEDLIKSGWQLLGLFFILTLISAWLIKDKVIFFPIFAWLWFGYEIWLNAAWVARTNDFNGLENNSGTNRFPYLVLRLTVMSWLKVSGCGLLFSLAFVLVINALGALLAPFLLTAFYGTCAGILRLVRSLPQDHAIYCQSCDDPMQQLSAEQLQQHIRQPEQVEIQLNNKAYEAWCCPTCAFNAPGEHVQVHLFSQLLNKRGYEDCLTCDALTVEISSETLESATTTSTGKRLITKYCHCCGESSEQESVIPKIVQSSSSISGSSYGSSSSSYSSSSGGSFGGGFGGGSSGGGGAGDSW